MSVYRFSATSIEGIPLVGTNRVETDGFAIARTMAEHAVRGQIMEQMDEPEDITPPYWDLDDTPFKFFLSSMARGSAIVHVMPTSDASEQRGLLQIGDETGHIVDLANAQRTFHLPRDHKGFVVTGDSPKYPGLKCMFEAFVDL